MELNHLTAIIGGTGFHKFPDFSEEPNTQKEVVKTPYGESSAPLNIGKIGHHKVVFLPRHGPTHKIAPHRINYRANLYALKSIHVDQVISLAAVGGMEAPFSPGTLVLPDQIIDYTWGREHTFYDGTCKESDFFSTDLEHIDFSHPFDEKLRKKIHQMAQKAGVHIVNGAVYGVTQGPRLETPTEINKMAKDGVHIVGMTAMPEAALAKEIGLAYSTIAMVVNEAAGRSPEAITMESIQKNLDQTKSSVLKILNQLFTIP